MKNRNEIGLSTGVAVLALSLLALIYFFTGGSGSGLSSNPNTQLAQVSSLDTGMVAWWKFDDGSGTQVLDSTGKGHNGSVSGSPVWSGGKIGGGLTFDGTNGVSVAPISWSSPNAVTVSAWVKTTDPKSAVVADFREAAVNNSGFTMVLSPNGGTAYTSAFCINNSRCPSASLQYPIADGNWHMLTGVFNGTNVYIYVDGVARNTQQYATPIVGTNMNVFIAKKYSTDGVVGTLDDIRLYDRALSAQEVMDLYNKGSSQADTYSLIVNKTGDGNGTVTGGQINCGSICTQMVQGMATIELTAAADPGTVFAGWSGGGCSGTGTCTVTLNSDQVISAQFNPVAGLVVKTIPAINSTKILPDMSTIPGDSNDTMTIYATRGEYEPASFVVRPDHDMSNVMITASNLQNGANLITTSDIDIKAVKVWYQSGVNAWISDESQEFTRKTPSLVPELMLNDDSLVSVDYANKINYVKLTNGSLYNVSDPTEPASQNGGYTSAEFPVKDAVTFQPIASLAANKAKQFWITVRVPETAPSGLYTGTVKISEDGTVVKTLTLNVNVYDFDLQDSGKINSIFYFGYYYPGRPLMVDDTDKSEAQYRAELLNMKKHGVTNPLFAIGGCVSCYDIDASIRASLGVNQGPLYAIANNMDFPMSTSSISTFLPGLINVANKYGYDGVYIYGWDELTSSNPAAKAIEVNSYFDLVHQLGGKTFVTTYGLGTNTQFVNTYGFIGDTLDLAVEARRKQPSIADAWHSKGKKIVSYADPQVGVESPYMNRANAGVAVWATGFDGTMDFAYQADFGKPWNDFDSPDFRDGMFTYPTIDNPIDTIGWEGYREALDDLRYLKTLENSIAAALTSGNSVKIATANQAQSYLNNLKSTILSGGGSGTYFNVSADLYAMRQAIANYISALGNGTTVPMDSAPSVSSSAATQVAQTTAMLNGNLTSAGSTAVSQHGFEWGNDPGLYTSTKISLGSKTTTGSFSSSLTGLVCDSNYYFRPYATNSIGTSYGGILSLRTTACTATTTPPTTSAPTVNTAAASSITTASVVLNGNVLSLGSSSISQHGFAWGTSATLISAATTSLGSRTTTGSFSSAISSIACGTTYYYRAYASNSAGTGYGPIASFASPACAPVTPTDWIAPSISGGYPTGNLSAATTQVTLKVSTNENAICRYSKVPGINYVDMVNIFTNTGTTKHSTLISGLTSGTTNTYYVRCKDASNNVNTSDYRINFKIRWK